MYNLYATLFARSPCVCERPMELTSKATAKSDDSKIYIFRDGNYHLYEISDVGRNSVSAYKVCTVEWAPLYRLPSFSLVGVFKVTGRAAELETIQICDISGKFIYVTKDLVVTICKAILVEAV